MSVENDLANRWSDMDLLYSESSYKSLDCFRLFYFHLKSLGMVFVYFSAIPYPFKHRAIDARGTAASIIQSRVSIWVYSCCLVDF